MNNKLGYIVIGVISGVILLCGCHSARSMKPDITTDCEDVITTKAEDGIIFIYEDESLSQLESSSKTDTSSESSSKAKEKSSSEKEESSSEIEDIESISSVVEEFVEPINSVGSTRAEQPNEWYVEPVITTTIEVKDSAPAEMETSEEYKEETPVYEDTETYWDGPVLNPTAGVVYGPSGKETYYNLDMGGVVGIMRGMGYSEEEYPYWVDGRSVKHLGPYIMCAANLDVHPRGTTVESSLGTCLVCDTGGFAYSNPEQLDIATSW